MALVFYHAFAFVSLFSYGLYHLISSTRSFFIKSSTATATYSAKPYHPLPLPSHRFLRHLPLHLSLLSLLLSILHHSLLQPHPLLSLQTSAALLLFLLLSLSLLLLPSLPPDLLFLLSSLAFSLLSFSSYNFSLSFSPSDLQSHCSALSSSISAASASFAFALALIPRLFVFDLALAASVALQGLWSLHTGLALYVDAFIPDGCHRLLDVADDSTRCDLDKSRMRATAMLDLGFAMHVIFVAVVVLVVYTVVGKISGALGGGGGGGGGLGRRYNGGASYEALPTSMSAPALSDLDHVQMKTIVKNSSAQE